MLDQTKPALGNGGDSSTADDAVPGVGKADSMSDSEDDVKYATGLKMVVIALALMLSVFLVTLICLNLISQLGEVVQR